MSFERFETISDTPNSKKPEEKVFIDINVLKPILFTMDFYEKEDPILENYYLQFKDVKYIIDFCLHTFKENYIGPLAYNESDYKHIKKLKEFIMKSFNQGFFDKVLYNTYKRKLEDKKTRETTLKILNKDRALVKKLIDNDLDLILLSDEILNNTDIMAYALLKDKTNKKYIGNELYLNRKFIEEHIFLYPEADSLLQKDTKMIYDYLKSKEITSLPTPIFNHEFYLDLLLKLKKNNNFNYLNYFYSFMPYFVHSKEALKKVLEKYPFLIQYLSFYSEFLEDTTLLKSYLTYHFEVLNTDKIREFILNNPKWFNDELLPLLKKHHKPVIDLEKYRGTFIFSKEFFLDNASVLFNVFSILYEYKGYNISYVLISQCGIRIQDIIKVQYPNMETLLPIKHILMILKSHPKYYHQLSFTMEEITNSCIKRKIQFLIDRCFLRTHKPINTYSVRTNEFYHYLGKPKPFKYIEV